MLLHNAAECTLGVLCHAVRLVKNYDLVGRRRKATVLLRGTYGSGADTAAIAKDLIFSRTTEMPRSSDAFSSSTRERMSSGLESVQKIPTQKAAWRVRELSTFFPYQAGHRTACAGASVSSTSRTLVDDSALRSTSTACCWDATSSMLLGRLSVRHIVHTTAQPTVDLHLPYSEGGRVSGARRDVESQVAYQVYNTCIAPRVVTAASRVSVACAMDDSMGPRPDAVQPGPETGKRKAGDPPSRGLPKQARKDAALVQLKGSRLMLKQKAVAWDRTMPVLRGTYYLC